MEKGGEDRESGLEEVGYRRNIIKTHWPKKKWQRIDIDQKIDKKIKINLTGNFKSS